MLKFKRTSGGTYKATTAKNNIVRIERHLTDPTWIMSFCDQDYNELEDWDISTATTKTQLMNRANHYNQNWAI